jgi:molecular chaperone HscA
MVKHSLIEIEALESALQNEINSGDKDAIRTAIENLNNLTKPMAELAMDKTISAAMKGKKI